LVEQDIDDLRDDVAGPLDGDRITDADVLALANGQAIAVPACDIILVVQRDIDHGDTADTDRIETRYRRQRASTPNLDFDVAHTRRGLLGRKFMRHGPARLACDEAPAALQIELVDLVNHAVD